LQAQGDLARVRGDLAGARASYGEALALAHRSAGARRVAVMLVKYAAVEAATRRSDRATRLLGAEAAWRAGAGGPARNDLYEYDSEDQAGALATVRAALDRATFAELWQVGQAMTLDQAVADALAKDAE
jgi:hypothetical protein